MCPIDFRVKMQENGWFHINSKCVTFFWQWREDWGAHALSQSAKRQNPILHGVSPVGCQTFRPYVTSASRRSGPFRPSDVSALDVSPDVSALDQLRLILTMSITFYLILSLFDCLRFCIQGIHNQENSYPIYEFSGYFKPCVRIIQRIRTLQITCI